VHYRGCELPEELFYDVERDVWARVEGDGSATLGMTDPAQSRCGKVVSVRFKAVGRRVGRGQSLATIESAKWVGPFPAILSGQIVATNEAAFRRDVLIANKDPYGAGWLVRIRPDRLAEERAALLTGAAALERYRARIDQAGINCMRCADDGGGSEAS
jgi:glycine cleavage system H protein